MGAGGIACVLGRKLKSDEGVIAPGRVLSQAAAEKVGGFFWSDCRCVAAVFVDVALAKCGLRTD